MLFKVSTPVPNSGLSLTRKLKTNVIHLRGSSQTPTLRKKFTPHLNKSFNCYEDPSNYTLNIRTSPNTLKETFSIRKTRNRIKVTGKVQKPDLLTEAKTELESKNYKKALELLDQISVEEKTVEVSFLRGLCSVNLKLFAEALAEFKRIQLLEAGYDPQLYAGIYACYEALNDISAGIRSLNVGLRLFPRNSKLALLRGQAQNRAKQYEKALRDLKRLNEPEAQLYIADSWKGLRDYDKALQHLEIALQTQSTNFSALIARAKIYYKINRLQESRYDLTYVLEANENCYEAVYYMGKIMIKGEELVQAGLSLEQVAHYTNDQQLCLRAICRLALIKIKERDFYGAIHTFQRVKLELNSAFKKSLFLFTESVLCLMKRKFTEGVELLSHLIESNSFTDYKHTCLLYRAYGYYSMGKYDKCLVDYKIAECSQVLDKASDFNFVISKGIVRVNEGSMKEAWTLFKSVQGMFSKNPISEVCQVCMLISLSSLDTKTLSKALRILNRGLKRRSDSELYFIKSLLLYLQQDFPNSFTAVKECIDKAEENVACHYAMRAFVNMALKQYNEAVQDFSISLQLDESLAFLYAFRGICCYLCEEFSLSVEDFLLFSLGMQEESLLAARLLVFAGAYTDALQVLSGLKTSDEVVVLKGYCELMTENYENSIKTLKNVEKIDLKQDIQFIHDILARNLTPRLPGYFFSQKYADWTKGVSLIYQGEYFKAIDVFQDLLELMRKHENEFFNDSIVIEEENCEILYNISLCSALANTIEHKEHALMILKDLSEVVNIEHRGQLYLICSAIEQSFSKLESAEILLKEAAKCNPDCYSRFVSGENVSILPLHTANEFSSRFELIPFPGNPKVLLRPSVVLPRLQSPLSLNDTFKSMKKLFNFSTIIPRPEAPWINRTKGSIQFTETILDIEVAESRKNSAKVELTQKICRSQKVGTKDSFFVNGKKKESVQGIIEKIKE
jgi:tetratricopeptide (TPR) repeat protein